LAEQEESAEKQEHSAEQEESAEKQEHSAEQEESAEKQEHSAEQEESAEEHRNTQQNARKIQKGTCTLNRIFLFRIFGVLRTFMCFENLVEQSDFVFRDHCLDLVHPTLVQAGVMKLLTQHPPAVGFAPADFFSREKINRVANFPRRMFSCRAGCAAGSALLTRRISLRRGNGGYGVTRGCGLRRLKGYYPLRIPSSLAR